MITGPNARVPTQDELCESDDSDCIKLLEGQPIALRSEYKAWSNARIEEDDKLRENPGPIEIVLTQGSDAEAERNATVTLAGAVNAECPNLDSNQDHDLRRVGCDPLHHRDGQGPTAGFAPASSGLQDRRLAESSHVGSAVVRGPWSVAEAVAHSQQRPG